jgi:hypothetical protein
MKRSKTEVDGAEAKESASKKQAASCPRSEHAGEASRRSESRTKTFRKSKLADEASRRSESPTKRASHDERKVTNGGVQAAMCCSLSLTSSEVVVPTTDGDVQTGGTNKSDDVFCEDGVTEGTGCESYADKPCVWKQEMENVVTVDEMEHAGTSTKNSSRRRAAYRHMFLIINGGPGMKGVRTQLPECVEKGVWALFPDSEGEFMGFKEA